LNFYKNFEFYLAIDMPLSCILHDFLSFLVLVYLLHGIYLLTSILRVFSEQPLEHDLFQGKYKKN